MSNIPVPQARYELLKDNTKKRFLNNKKLCVIASIILLIAASTGIVLLFVNLQYFIDGFTLPDSYQPQEFPQQWFQRAIKYNSFNENYFETTLRKSSPNKYSFQNFENYKLVCYYSILDPRYLLANNLDPNLCTHINVGFVSINNSNIVLTGNVNETLRDVVALKQQNKNLKVLISIGGAGNETGFAQMVVNHQNRKIFIRSVLLVLKEFKLDGVDLDWEFPNENQKGDKKQRMHFTQLLYEIRKEINRHEKKKQFLLTVAVAAPQIIIDNAYDIPYINSYVDFVNLMSYDFHFYTTVTPFTGLNSPLYAGSTEKGYFQTLNINSSVFYWHESGMDKSKIVVGLPTYGHSFNLINPINNGLVAPANGYGKLGHLGFVDYSDVCWFLNYYQIQPIFDFETKSPYAFKSSEWISFDDKNSLSYKTEFIKDHNFGGAMILSLNTDDHKGSCGQNGDETFPLTRKVKSILMDDQL